MLNGALRHPPENEVHPVFLFFLPLFLIFLLLHLSTILLLIFHIMHLYEIPYASWLFLDRRHVSSPCFHIWVSFFLVTRIANEHSLLHFFDNVFFLSLNILFRSFHFDIRRCPIAFKNFADPSIMQEYLVTWGHQDAVMVELDDALEHFN